MAKTKSDGGGKTPLAKPRPMGPPMNSGPIPPDVLKRHFPQKPGTPKATERGPFFGSERKTSMKSRFVPTKKLNPSQITDRRAVKGANKGGSFDVRNPWEVGKPTPGRAPSRPTVPKKGMGGH